MILKRSKIITNEGVDITRRHHKGKMEANLNHPEAVRNSATAKYLCKVRQVLGSQLNGQNKIQAVNTYALTFIKYPGGIITWPKWEIEAIDINT